MKKIIAILDDEPEMEEIYSLVLEKEIREMKIHLNFFSDARNFVVWIENNKPDIVFTDIHMPHLTGHDVLKLVRRKHQAAKTYIISGDEESVHQEAMNEYGVSSFLSKPINLFAFQGKINL